MPTVIRPRFFAATRGKRRRNTTLPSTAWSIALAFLGTSAANLAHASVVAEWNQIALTEVRKAKQGPPIVARALAVAHTCMYDAWAAYDKKAIGTRLGSSLRRPAPERTDANKAQAVSYAAYRCLLNLYPAGATRLRTSMLGLGYDPDNLSTDLATPAGVGNVAAQAVLDYRRFDGANQYGALSGGVAYAEPTMAALAADGLLGTGSHYATLYAGYQSYLASNRPLPYCSPQITACPAQIIDDPLHWQPLFNSAGVLQTYIGPNWDRVIPFALASASQFDAHNAVKQRPSIQSLSDARYANNVREALRYSAAITPERKLIIEYWADGPDSELPPGHWGVFAQYVSQRDSNSIDADAKMFFAMHNASFDAGIVAWHFKRKYDGVRPITAVRYLMQGQAVKAWGGPGRPVEWVQGEKWIAYNPGSNPTPAFPGYVSGHSTFSAASATVLQKFTGSDKFGFSTVIPANFGRVEPGVPAVPTTISYKKFSDAAAEAGLSRLYGGIHFSDDNDMGQDLGQSVGELAWERAKKLFNGEQP